MSVKKLSDSDKQEILNLYRTTEDTTSTLATRYGVSNSTISRFLKNSLPESEYEALIATKRSSRTHTSGTVAEVKLESSSPPIAAREAEVIQISPSSERVAEVEEVLPARPIVGREAEVIQVSPSSAAQAPEEFPSSENQRRRRRRSSAIESQPAQDLPEAEVLSKEVPVSTAPREEAPVSVKIIEVPVTTAMPQKRSSPILQTRKIDVEEKLIEELEEELAEDLDDSDLDDEDDDDEDWDDDSDFAQEDGDLEILLSRKGSNVQVLPLSEASLPRTCYLVVDKAAELIARPLKDFGDLGQIPVDETQEKTLPIFDNHRVARRFSNRTQRVIKVPDGRMLQKTCSQLQAKGITRLLIDGQVYSLST